VCYQRFTTADEGLGTGKAPAELWAMSHLAGLWRGAEGPSFNQERHMKKYVKPSLTGLGLLRDVTKFSGCRFTYCG
jgi:hypothetical protein